MKKQLLSLVIIILFNFNTKAQIKNTFYTHVSDSGGYQSYYAIEIIKKGKPIKQHFREAVFVRFNFNKKPVKGRWYFKNFPDTIIVQRGGDKEDIIIAANSLKTIAFKLKDNYTGLQAGAATVAVLGGIANPGVIVGASNSGWSSSYLLLNGKSKARIVIKKETEKEKLAREKIEKSNQERFEKKQNKK